ncbi:MAG: hypothetical protein ACI8QC_003851 [Planctomycetota bacterium]|jgi:hypothetical protein
MFTKLSPQALWVPLVLGLGASLTPLQAQCEVQSSTPADNSAEARFGATVHVDGNRALVAALRADGYGAAYVYERSGNTWLETAKLSPSDGVAGDGFGLGLAIEGDRIVVGSMEANGGGNASGKAYAFERQADVWVETQQLVPADSAAGDWFGVSVAISGEWLVIGARQDNSGSFNGGTAYIYRYGPAGWVLFDEVVPPAVGNGDVFGHGIAISGLTMAVGASGWDGPSQNAGSVFIWEFDGSAWVKTQRVRPDVPQAGNFFGLDLDLEGDRLLVGARGHNGAGGTDSGSAYVFERGPNGFEQSAKLESADSNALDELGNKVSLSGERVLIGCWLDSDTINRAGAAYVFELTAGTWSEVAKLTPSLMQDGALFGHDVDLFEGHAFVGAYRASVEGPQSGALSIHDLGNSPEQHPFCPSLPNSTGQPAQITASGSQSLGADDTHIGAHGLPASQPALLLYASGRQLPMPFGDGNLCLSNAGVGILHASSLLWSDAQGNLDWPLHIPGLQPGTHWSFQWLYRDPAGPTGTNLSAALALSFCP